MPFPDFDPVLLQLGPIAIRWYALAYVAGILLGWRNKLDLLRLADVICAAYPIGHFLGRIANFINGELWGRPTDAPWGMVFCNKHILQTLGYCPAGTVPRHPSQLYEAALEGLALFLILRWATHGAKLTNRRGVVVGMFLVLYAVFRIAIENVRQPDQGLENLPLGLTMGMILSFPMIVGGLYLIWRGMREPLPPALEAHEPA